MMKQEWSDSMKNVQIMNEKELEKKQVLVNQLERYRLSISLIIISIIVGN